MAAWNRKYLRYRRSWSYLNDVRVNFYVLYTLAKWTGLFSVVSGIVIKDGDQKPEVVISQAFNQPWVKRQRQIPFRKLHNAEFQGQRYHYFRFEPPYWISVVGQHSRPTQTDLVSHCYGQKYSIIELCRYLLPFRRSIALPVAVQPSWFPSLSRCRNLLSRHRRYLQYSRALSFHWENRREDNNEKQDMLWFYLVSQLYISFPAAILERRVEISEIFFLRFVAKSYSGKSHKNAS